MRQAVFYVHFANLPLRHAIAIEGDPHADALYICVSDLQVSYSQELSESIVADFAEDGTLVGIDVQRVSVLAAKQRGSHGREAVKPRWPSNFGAEVGLVGV